MLHLSRTIDAAGTAVLIECDDDHLSGDLSRVTADLPLSSDAEAAVQVVTTALGFDVSLRTATGVEHLGTGETRQHALGVALWALGRVVALRRSIVLHAGAVAGRRGAVVFVGTSGAGKSTLAAAAADAGLVYIADDMVGIDDDCAVPYPRPLMIRPGGQVVLDEVLHRRAVLDAPRGADGCLYVAPSHLGATISRSPVPIAAIVVLERSDHPRLTPMNRAATLHALVAHCSMDDDHADVYLDVLTSIARRVPGHRLGVDPRLEAVSVLSDLVAG